MADNKVVIEFEEIVTRRVTVNCTDLQVARELFEAGPDHILEMWVEDSVAVDSRIDRDSGSFIDPDVWVRERG